MAEQAGIWVRVSTGEQSEDQQVPAVEAHCASHGYTIAKRYELNDISASKGEQQAKLDEMLADMRDGTITVLVCWRSNRLERRGPEALFKLLRQVKDARGRIESTTEPMLGTEDLSGEAITAIQSVMDKQFSAKLSEDTNRAIQSIKASGHVYNGNAPWGFEIVGPKYGKTLEPTALAREYIPQIFDRCIAGDSLRTIAAWLDSENVPTARGGKWNEGSVRWILRCRDYAKHGVIRPSIHDRAIEALRSRPKRGPSKPNRPMLAKLRCNRCGSPMYRITAGKAKREFYRCFGSGPQRKGCGNMVPFALTEFIVASQIFVNSTEPHTVKTWIDGQTWDDEISNVKQSIREAVEAERFDLMPELQARLGELRSRENVPGHYEETETGETVGEHFWHLTPDGKRDYLASRDIRVEKSDMLGSVSVRVVIDGGEAEEYPVSLFEPLRLAQS